MNNNIDGEWEILHSTIIPVFISRKKVWVTGIIMRNCLSTRHDVLGAQATSRCEPLLRGEGGGRGNSGWAAFRLNAAVGAARISALHFPTCVISVTSNQRRRASHGRNAKSKDTRPPPYVFTRDLLHEICARHSAPSVMAACFSLRSPSFVWKVEVA